MNAAMPLENSASGRPLCIALLPQGGAGWIGGELYFRHLFEALLDHRRRHPEHPLRLVLVTADPERLIASHGPYRQADQLVDPRPTGWRRRLSRLRHIANRLLPPALHLPGHDLTGALRRAGVDFAYPFVPRRASGGRPRGAAWIPDFQHRHLPHLFSDQERRGRDHDHAHLAADAPEIVFSSVDAINDFQRFYPTSPSRPHCLHFCSLPDAALWQGDPLAIQRHYHLPDRFLLCSGQFWRHKNQSLVLEALAALQAGHPELFVVFTGHIHDYRAPETSDRFFAAIHEQGLRQQLAVLGLIPRQHQLQLMRRCVAVLQPSLFEGWSTVVEDARALGRPIVLSNLPVHREQNPPDGLFFERHSSASLASAMAEAWQRFEAGPDPQREAEARRASAGRLEAMADDLIAIATASLERS